MAVIAESQFTRTFDYALRLIEPQGEIMSEQK
jgi:hypothetical protein